MKCVHLLLTQFRDMIIIKKVWHCTACWYPRKFTPTEKKNKLAYISGTVCARIYSTFCTRKIKVQSPSTSSPAPSGSPSEENHLRRKTSSCSVAVGRLFKNSSLTIGSWWIILHYLLLLLLAERISTENFTQVHSQIYLRACRADSNGWKSPPVKRTHPPASRPTWLSL